MPINPDDEELTIKTGGKTLGGWLAWRVVRGVERLPSTCDIRLTEVSPGSSQAVVKPGSTCEVFLSDDKVLTGYIDRYLPVIDKDSHEVRIICRSKTEDIVDCSPDTEKLGTYAFVGGTIGEAAKKLSEPYGIEVKLPDGDEPLPIQGYFDMSPGYTAYQLIEEMARSVGMLVWDDADGNLVLSKGGTGGRAATSLILGQNVERAEVMLTMDQRFSRYLVLSQAVHPSEGHFNVAGRAYDKGVPRERLRTIQAEALDVGEEQSERRAKWEANRRYGRSQMAKIVVTGWRDGADKLWRPNTMTHVTLNGLHVDADRVLSQVAYIRDDYGTRTEIELMPIEGLAVRPIIPLPPVPIENRP